MDKDNKENYMNDLLEMMRFIENAAYEENWWRLLILWA